MAKHGKSWKPGGHKGKLHRELGVPVSEPIPPARLESAMNSDDPEIRRDAIRAHTMEGWDHHHSHHGGTHGRHGFGGAKR